MRCSDCQRHFQTSFYPNSEPTFTNQDLRHTIPNTPLSSTDVTSYIQYLQKDISDIYYKGILSLAEGLISIRNEHYSWATVKLYYATYYLLRCALYCNRIVVVRGGRVLFFVKLQTGNKYATSRDSTDHKGVIEISKKLMPNEYLLSNLVDGQDAYTWLASRREEVNYKDCEFHEPDPPPFLSQIKQAVQSEGLENFINRILDNIATYGFQSDYAAIAIPLKRLEQTNKLLAESGFTIIIDAAKWAVISSMLPIDLKNL